MTPNNKIKNSKVIVHADDLGLCLSFNEGIRKGFKEGLLTSTCVRVNGTSFEHAVDEVIPDCSGIGLGVHLNIVEGRTLRKNVKRSSFLCNSDNEYKNTFFDLYRYSKSEKFLNEVEEDYRNQIELSLKYFKKIDHLNTHQHSHAIPNVFKIVCRLAKEYDIPFVRLPKEKFYFVPNFAKHLHSFYIPNIFKWVIINYFANSNLKYAESCKVRTNDEFVGVLYTGNMDIETVKYGLKRIKGTGKIIEILVHPCDIVAGKDEKYLTGVRDYVFQYSRYQELSLVQNQEFFDIVKEMGCSLTNYSAISINDGNNIDKIKEEIFQSKRKQAPSKRLRVFAIMDETPFYHPEYLRRLIAECEHIELVGAAVVVLPKGGLLQSYLLSRWREMGLTSLILLGLKSYYLKIKGMLPKFVRGTHYGSIKQVLRNYNIPCRTVSCVNNNDFISYIKSFSPDVMLSSNSLIFGEELLSIPKIAAINRHSALSPSMGGLLPAFRAIQFNEKYFGVSVHTMTKKVDSGKVLSRKWFPLEKKDTVDDMYKHSFFLSYEATNEAFKRLKTTPIIYCGDEGITKSYFSFPDLKDWNEFKENNGSFI